MPKGKRIQVIPIDEIRVIGKRRRLNARKVEQIADSIRAIGLRMPITVHINKNGETFLDAGLHRLEAMKRLGITDIDCAVSNEKKRRRQLWQDAENICRAPLTALEKAEAVARSIRNIRKLAEGEPDLEVEGGNQPGDKGVNKSARRLGLSREAIRRARDIDGLSSEAKQAAKEAGLDRNQDALLKIAKEQTAEAQLQKIDDLAARPKREPYRPSSDERRQLKSLKKRLHKARNLRREASKASPYALRMLAREIIKLGRASRPTKSSSK